MHLEVFESALLGRVTGLFDQKVEGTGLRIGLDATIPALPVQVADPLAQLAIVGLGKVEDSSLDFSNGRHGGTSGAGHTTT